MSVKLMTFSTWLYIAYAGSKYIHVQVILEITSSCCHRFSSHLEGIEISDWTWHVFEIVVQNSNYVEPGTDRRRKTCQVSPKKNIKKSLFYYSLMLTCIIPSPLVHHQNRANNGISFQRCFLSRPTIKVGPVAEFSSVISSRKAQKSRYSIRVMVVVDWF